MYIEDQIRAGNWNFSLGIRGDIYNGSPLYSSPS